LGEDVTPGIGLLSELKPDMDDEVAPAQPDPRRTLLLAPRDAEAPDVEAQAAGGGRFASRPDDSQNMRRKAPAPGQLPALVERCHTMPDLVRAALPMQSLNTHTVQALVVLVSALSVAVPVLYGNIKESCRSNQLILLGGLAWVPLVLLNWDMSFFVV
jgi:photosystem II PsbZ protein